MTQPLHISSLYIEKLTPLIQIVAKYDMASHLGFSLHFGFCILAASISASYGIRKFDRGGPVEALPRPPRPTTEPAHHAGHALRRDRLARALHARPA